MPEATTDGSGTDKYLAAMNKPEPVPIHLKITTNGGKVEGVEQVSASQQTNDTAQSSTIQLPPIELPKN